MVVARGHLNPEHADLGACKLSGLNSAAFWRAALSKRTARIFRQRLRERIKVIIPLFEKPEDILVLMAGGAVCTPWLCLPGVREPTATVM